MAKNIPKLAQTHGNIFGLRSVGRNIVCLVGYDLIKEVITDRAKEFPDRSASAFVGNLVRGEERHGIAIARYGPKWAANRKFFHNVLQNMGLNRRGMETCIRNEVPYMVDEIERLRENESVLDPAVVFDYATLNILAYFSFGKRYEYGDAMFEELLSLNNQFFQSSHMVRDPILQFVSVFSNLYKYWLPSSGKALIAISGKIQDFVKSEIADHRRTIDESSPRDFIDYFIINMKKNGETSTTDMEMTIMDLFQAGTETTATTLRWALLYLANNPHIQEKVHNEIDKILGMNPPHYEDRLKMPYTEATALETQRKASITPIGLIHSPLNDTKIRGYNVPKGTMLLTSYHSVHFSPEHWKNPLNFDPENFLDPDGKVGSRSAFFPFGGGLRICIGQSIAKQELFLFLTSLLQKYKVLPPPGVERLDETGIEGLTIGPVQYKVQMIPRF